MVLFIIIIASTSIVGQECLEKARYPSRKYLKHTIKIWLGECWGWVGVCLNSNLIGVGGGEKFEKGFDGSRMSECSTIETIEQI
jgi:hypothetical protein